MYAFSIRSTHTLGFPDCPSPNFDVSNVGKSSLLGQELGSTSLETKQYHSGYSLNLDSKARKGIVIVAEVLSRF